MRDIIVTTPKDKIALAAQEAAECIKNSSGVYFRRFVAKPLDLGVGSRIFYVEDGFLRGFAIVSKIVSADEMVCGTSGQNWGPGYYAFMEARSWKWIQPIPMRGFQGWKYIDARSVAGPFRSIRIVGDWLAPKPTPKPK